MARYDDDDDDRDEEDEEDRPIRKKRRRGGDASEGGFLGFVLFRRFVGHWIIIILFWIAVVIIEIGGLVFMVIGIIAGARGGGGAALAILFTVGVSLLGMIVYPILLRIYVEIVLLLYRMHEALLEIRDNTG